MKRVVGVLCLIFMSICPFVADAQVSKDALIQLQKLNRVYRNITTMYVDSLEMEPIVESAIREMLLELDPHSSYLTAKEMKSQQESFAGEFGGVGIEYNIYRDTIIVVNTIAQGPAQKVGVLPNDRIVEIDGESVVGIKRDDVSPKLRGDAGSVVNIGVVRHGVEQILPFTIIRDKIPITAIDAVYEAAPRVGYIKVNRFGHTTMPELRDAMQRLSGVESIILDLSGNSGGLLGQAVDMAGYFLPQDAHVVSIEGRAIGSQRMRSKQGAEFDGRMVVIIDEGSASGSEIVAGALQDWDRAVVIGRPSFGKGLVQRQIPLGDGSAMRLTVARYHTPSGRVIQRPYEKGHKDEYYAAYAKRLQGNKEDSVADNKEVYRTLRSRREVYGGGGIHPDILIQSDTTQTSKYMSRLIAAGLYNEFIMDYMDRNRAQLEADYPTFELFQSGFSLTDEQLSGLVDMATARGVEYDADGYKRSRELIRCQLTAMIAQRLYTENEFYRVLNPYANKEYMKALEILANWQELAMPILNPAQ